MNKAPKRVRRSMSDPKSVEVRSAEGSCIIETPMGPKEVFYAKWRDDQLLVEYRGEDVSETSMERLRAAIDRIEEEHQVKKTRDDKRKAVAKTPEPAFYWPMGHAYGSRGGTTVEQVKVRGFDLRSKGALVIREDGSRETIPWAHLIRDLNDSEYQDVLAANRRYREAEVKASAREFGERSVEEVLEPAQVEVEVHFDFEAGDRYLDFEGKRYRGETKRAAVSKVYAVLCERAGYPFTTSRYSDDGLASVHQSDNLADRSDVWPSQEAYQAYEAAQAVVEGLEKECLALKEEFAFDESLVMVPDEPEPIDEDADERVTVAVRAPEGSGDWDDESS